MGVGDNWIYVPICGEPGMVYGQGGNMGVSFQNERIIVHRCC